MLRDGVELGVVLDDEDRDLVPAAPPQAPEPEPEPEVVSGREGFLARLDERFPRLSAWLGGRLDMELPAVAASLMFHLALLGGLGMIGYAVHRESGAKIEARALPVDTTLPDLEENTAFQDIDQRPEDEKQVQAGSFAPVLSVMNVSTEASLANVAAPEKNEGPSSLAVLDVQRAALAAVPSAELLGQNVAIKGSGDEHVGEAEGAVDRLADEILGRLEKGRVLVVWAFDASGSLQAERERLAKHIEGVYGKIRSLGGDQLAGEGGLLTAVVAFGQDRKTMTAAPTADADTIASAIRAVPLDSSGIESTFRTVGEIVQKWGRYKDAKGNAYKTMVIVVTDEVGDDEDNLEGAIKVATERKVPVYVLGSQAIFARTEGRMDYTDPKTGRKFFNVPVRQGPESVVPEQIRLPFWYGGDQYDVLDSGFGPYALTRLAGATGGIYFITRLGPNRAGFDPAALREYKPDWVSRSQYEAAVLNHPVRKAVIEAALLTQQNLPGMPSLVFPPVDGERFKDAMEANQAIAARTAYTVDAALEPINAVAKLRDVEPSRRWQAHFDLIRGRLLAMKVRCYEYNWACAQMKKDAPKFTKPNSNAWRLVPDAEIHYSDKAATAGKQAVDLLKKVVAEHPNTPWGLFASRELKDPLGFKWVETYIKPEVRRENDSAETPAKKKARQMAEKPVEPPKL